MLLSEKLDNGWIVGFFLLTFLILYGRILQNEKLRKLDRKLEDFRNPNDLLSKTINI